MPSPFSIDPAAKLVRIHLDGEVTPVGVKECLDAALSSPQFGRGFHFVAVRPRAALRLSASQLQDVAALVRVRAPRIAPCRWAFVVAAEEDFPAVRMLALLANGSGVTVAPFTNLSCAEEWARGSARL